MEILCKNRQKHIFVENFEILIELPLKCQTQDQPSGRPPPPREGIYIGESSRSIHERALEHVRDARTFSVKSHIVKHWMSSHPTLPTPPEMEFTVTRRFKDCLSRQMSKALRINNSTDVLLNSKGEYGNNSVSRLVVQEDAWVRRERDRLEEEQAELTKRQVDQFKHQKMMKEVAGLDRKVPDDPDVRTTVDGQGGSVTALTGTMCNIVEPITVLQENYETDEEEFSGGKNNTKETEAGPGGSVTALTGLQSNSIYETDEDEFLRSGGEEEIKPAVPTTFHALYDVHVPRKMKNTAKRKITPHSLAYFSLWWMRMEVEGRKDARRRQKKEEDEEKSRKKRLMRRKKKDINIKEMESKPDCYQILQKDNESSFEFLVEGAILESTGSGNLYFMDGTRADETRQLSTVSRTSLDSNVVD